MFQSINQTDGDSFQQFSNMLKHHSHMAPRSWTVIIIFAVLTTFVICCLCGFVAVQNVADYSEKVLDTFL